jgi:hypothetical protein
VLTLWGIVTAEGAAGQSTLTEVVSYASGELDDKSRVWDNDRQGMTLPPGTMDHHAKSIRPAWISNKETDLGDSLSLLGDDIDPTSTVVKMKINSEQLARLISPSSYSSELSSISNTVYSKFKDDFDFLFFVLDKDDSSIDALGFYGVNIRISNNVQGLGLNISDRSKSWGSDGKLKSAMFFPYFGAISGGPALHELCHNWGAYICDTYAPDNTSYSGHWGISNAGGQLGGFKYVRTVGENIGGETGKTQYQASFRSSEKNEDGSFKNGGFGVNANGGNSVLYSDIELYLMGMKSAQELRTGDFTLDIYSGNSYDPTSFQNGYFYSTKKTSYTIDDLITLRGERVPDASASQKHFKVLTVLLSDESGAGRLEDIIKDLNWFGGSISDTTYPSRRIYNFAQATGGVGSLEVDGVKNSLLKGYAITLPSDVTGGRITADKKTAEAGETVTLTIAPDNGYVLDIITAYNANNPAEIIMLFGTGDTRTFTMPAYPVKLDISFKAGSTGGYPIDLPDNTPDGRIASDKESAQPGETVTLIIIPGNEYELEMITAYYYDANQPKTVELFGSGNTRTFTMPAYRVYIEASFRHLDPGRDVYDVILPGYISGGTVMASFTTARGGETVTLTITPYSGYELDVISVHKVGDLDTEVTLSGYGGIRTFIMPAYDVMITASFKTIVITPPVITPPVIRPPVTPPKQTGTGGGGCNQGALSLLALALVVLLKYQKKRL